MSAPWIVFIPEMQRSLVHPTELDAREAVAHVNAVTDGNVEAIAMPFSVAKSAPGLLAALNALTDASENAIDSFGGHSLECDCEQCVALSKLAPVVEFARNAIAEAEGGAS